MRLLKTIVTHPLPMEEWTMILGNKQLHYKGTMWATQKDRSHESEGEQAVDTLVQWQYRF